MAASLAAFSVISADTIISPHGSNLANIIFCDPETKIFEIGPNYTFDFEKNIKTKYEKLANLSGLKYFKINADTVNVKNHSKIAMMYVSKKILDKSSHFKNMIVKSIKGPGGTTTPKPFTPDLEKDAQRSAPNE